jgi:hypothetical protein
MKDVYVTRPETWGRQTTKKTNILADAIIKTADNGKALRVNLNGRKVANTQNVIRQELRRRGYNLHYTYNPKTKTVLMWVDARKEKP